MKKSKKLLSCFLAVLMLICAVPMAVGAAEASSGQCGDNVYWTFENGTLTISGSGDMWNYPLLESPFINNDVTADNTSIKNAVIENGVTSIGDDVFYGCENLKDVYYTGSKAEWNKISIDEPNDRLKNVTIHFEKESPLTPETCSHLCHKGGFVGFIYKLIKPFWKLFKMNETCACGVRHY
ncbi:MAG: leucine-rich repeat domain-containing protein [Ruminococcus sp.]|nr:leucine-rich repeat domain-containing protein [Ruminococcus sp.]